MTILAQTKDYLVEFEAGYLTISRYTDGHCKGWKKRGIKSDFVDSVKHAATRGRSVEHVIDLFLHMMRRAEWEPSMYKLDHMPGREQSSAVLGAIAA